MRVFTISSEPSTTCHRSGLERFIAGLLLLLALSWSGPALGQCPPSWLPGQGIAGVNGEVTASTMWDPDGPGPRQPVLVVSGPFTLAGETAASRIAAFDPHTGRWEALGSGLSANAFALAVLPGGDLVAAGLFVRAGGSVANYIARWNGVTWQRLGAGLNQPVRHSRSCPTAT